MTEQTTRQGFKFVAADLTTRNHKFSYLDALRTGEPIVAADPTVHPDPCPRRPGDGLCVASTVAAASSGGQPVSTAVGLLVEYDQGDVLAEGHGKVRVRALRVTGVFDPTHLIRSGLCANLRGANLQDVNLRDANLRGVNLRDANLQGAHLQGANLQGAHLQGANLQYANLRYAELRDADLQDADLQYANLQDVNLQDADLRYADLQGADLQDANLRGAELRGANLQGADLQGADLPEGFVAPKETIR